MGVDLESIISHFRPWKQEVLHRAMHIAQKQYSSMAPKMLKILGDISREDFVQAVFWDAVQYVPDFDPDEFQDFGSQHRRHLGSFLDNVVFRDSNEKVLLSISTNLLTDPELLKEFIAPGGAFDMIYPHESFGDTPLPSYVVHRLKLPIPFNIIAGANLMPEIPLGPPIPGGPELQAIITDAELQKMGVSYFRRKITREEKMNMKRDELRAYRRGQMIYKHSVIAINTAYFLMKVPRAVYLQSGRSDNGIPREINSTILELYQGASMATGKQHDISPNTIAFPFPFDWEALSRKEWDPYSGTNTDLLGAYAGAHHTWEAVAENMRLLGRKEPLTTYVTLNKARPYSHWQALSQEVDWTVPNSPKEEIHRVANFLVRYGLLERERTPADEVATSIWANQEKPQSDVLEHFERRHYQSRGVTYKVGGEERHLRFTPHFQDPRDAFDAGVILLSALGIIEYKGGTFNILNESALRYFNNRGVKQDFNGQVLDGNFMPPPEKA